MVKKFKLFCLTLVLVILLNSLPTRVFSQTATIPINISVKGTLTISDANNDSSSGKNPTINVDLSITPDLGATEVSSDAKFRIRTNLKKWKLTAQRTKEVDDGPTNIKADDVGVEVTTQAGSKADPNAGKLLSPFNSKTDLSKISTSRPVDVIKGQNKTSKQRDNSNADNYFQVNTTYSIFPDFFYTPGTWKTTITYNLVSP